MIYEHLRSADPELYEAIRQEALRQSSQLELIASENFVSRAVLDALGTVLTNKYAEGLPGKRYYGGCEWVDVAENLARDRAKELFGADHANVQPHSGAQANQAVYLTFLKPGDRFIGMNLSHGGHLTHGSPVNFSGMLFQVSAYGVRESDQRIDYDALREQAKRELPVRLLELAAQHGLTVTRISIRNQRSRWGSCSRSGHICLNWRLVQMPATVRDYVLIHELMHLKRMDHSRVFWKLVAAACPEYNKARAWLRSQSAR